LLALAGVAARPAGDLCVGVLGMAARGNDFLAVRRFGSLKATGRALGLAADVEGLGWPVAEAIVAAVTLTEWRMLLAVRKPEEVELPELL
jgi:hypothetical protein